MVQTRGGAGLTLEALDERLVEGELARQHFDGYVALQGRLVGFVDHGHPAAAYLLHDLILTQSPSNEV
jgi:hypothetical protein